MRNQQLRVRQHGVATCAAAASEGGQTFPITGALTYEYRRPKVPFTGYEEQLSVDTAKAIIVIAYDGDTYLGGAYTDYSDGTFKLEATQKPGPETSLYFFPMIYSKGDSPRFAVAHPSTHEYSNLKSDAYWSYGRKIGATQDAGTMLITEPEGSPAIYIHQWILYSLDQAELNAPDAKPFSLIALWEPGERSATT
jgi:hypothetical protein